jgi:hypothetical protein
MRRRKLRATLFHRNEISGDCGAGSKRVEVIASW